MVTHHTVNGCNLQVGDVLGSGTVSGPTGQEAGALIELTENGSRPVILDGGEQRAFIEDGDAIILRGFCERQGFARIGFGESRGEVLRPLGGPS
jgi:fumarylacetoacetase